MRRVVAGVVALVVAALGLPIVSATPAGASGVVVAVAATPSGGGQWTVTSDGTVTAGGDAAFLGDVGGKPLARPIIGIASTPSGRGYWLVATDGGIFSYGDAVFRGSTGGIPLNQPIVGMATTPSGNGYWLVARDGGIFTFGDAVFRGSTGGIPLNQPIVGMASTRSGNGYWLVATDGGIFTFGDAVFRGSTGGVALLQPIAGMTPSSSGNGYYLVARDGGLFTFGDAVFVGSAGGGQAGAPVVGMAPAKGGYRLAASNGAVLSFAVFRNGPVVTGGRRAADWPFASDSPWNMPLGAGAAYAADGDPTTGSINDLRSVAWINAAQYSHPIYQARDTDPTATFRRNGYPDVSYKVPANAVPAAGSDKHLHVVDPTGRYVDESWATGGSFPNFTTGYHVRTDLDGPGVGQGGVRAYGGSAIGGLIRQWEVDQGTIRHALAIALDGFQLARGPVWPATNQDGNASNYSGAVRMGQLLAIPANVDVDSMGLTPAGAMLARALQDYGAYVVDQSGATALYAEPSLEPTPALAAMRGDFTRLRRLLRVVTNNRADNVGGGGARRAPLAPPLG